MIVQQLHDEAPLLLSAMIVDDDPTSLRRLKSAIKDHPAIAVECTARTIVEAVRLAAAHHPHVVFLDVSAARPDAIAIASQLSENRALVVIADRPDFAFEAFECGAIDYLLKPVDARRLRTTLQRIERLHAVPHEPQTAANMPTSPNQPVAAERVSIPCRQSPHGKTTDLVPLSDVVWVESLQNYTVVQLPGRDRRSIKRTLTEWESLLPARAFARIGRSHLIQLAKLRAIESPARNEWLAHFHGVGQPLRLGRAAAGKLKAILRGSCPA